MVTRREALTLAGRGGAAGLLAATAVMAVQCQPIEAPAAEADPLLDLVRAYEDGLDRYNAVPDDVFDKLTEDGRLQRETYGPHYEAILAGPPAATSMKGVIRALRRLSTEMAEGGDTDFATAIVGAVLPYLEGRAA